MAERKFKTKISFETQDCGDGCCSWSTKNVEIVDLSNGNVIYSEEEETLSPHEEYHIQMINEKIESYILNEKETCLNEVEFEGYNLTRKLEFNLTSKS